MTSKNCCCRLSGCEWCNHEDPEQENYKEVTGTIVTEIPSIGHPLTDQTFNSSVYYDPFEGKSLLRTKPPGRSSWGSKVWGPATQYGDIQPCWFNGIKMKNVTEDNPYHRLKFVLKIRKKISTTPSSDVVSIDSPDYVDVVNISWNGVGQNLRPHPDTCGSYNITSNLFLVVDNGCGVFGQPNEDGTNPCAMDFAKMPRGPWPYRLKRNLIPDTNSDNCYYINEDGDRVIYTVDQAKKYNDSVPPNLQCPFIETSCRELGASQYSPYYTCCMSGSDSFCSSSEFCNGLDDEGTPYGWEDCPYACGAFSLYNKDELHASNRRFFCWWNPNNRYTTPEWDVKDGVSNNTRKMSIHVVVPTVKSGVDFCKLDNPDIGFGEWSFGMDLEAPDEIAALESSGFVFSNGREKKGVWINKTPTNALRVLFTLDHADLEPGKVWRVFNDWNVKTDGNGAIIWDKNVGTGNEFIVYVEQVLEELAFSSLGCDCPSGGITQGTQACEFPQIEYSFRNCAGLPRLSFVERGPLAIRFYADTDDTGTIGTCDNPNPDPRDASSAKTGTRTCDGHGTIMFADAGTVPNSTTISYYPSDEVLEFGIPYLGKTVDIPHPKYTAFGVNSYRYRSLYTAVKVTEYINEWGGNKDLYGSLKCSELGRMVDEVGECTSYTVSEIYDYGPIMLTTLPNFSLIEPCTIPYQFCDLERCTNDIRSPKEKKCTENFVQPHNRPSNPDPDEQCEFSVCRAQNTMQPMCPETVILYGIDSDNIYFQANASETTVAYLGDPECYHSAYKPWCGYDNKCKCGFNNDVNFYYQGGPSYGGGFSDTIIKWRKYYCQKYDSGKNGGQADTSQIPVDLMGKLYLECDGTNQCNSEDFCGCRNFWHVQCGAANDTLRWFPDIYNYGKWMVRTKKYDGYIQDSYFGYYDTNYTTNPAIDKEEKRSGNTITLKPPKKIT